MKLENIRDAARSVVRLLDEYAGGHVGRRETHLDPILYGYLQGRFGHFTRQHYLHLHGASRPRRIDFRRGTHNPVVIEFAVRPSSGVGTLTGAQNQSELRKLCRVTNATARLRVLLLIDLYSKPMDREHLKATYERQTSGRGNFVRHSVRVLYVHRDQQFDFLWRP